MPRLSLEQTTYFLRPRAPLGHWCYVYSVDDFASHSQSLGVRTSPLRQFGTEVRRLRTERGLSQEALGYEAGLHRTFVGAVERGEVNISLVNILRLAHALRVAPAVLLRGLKAQR